MSSASCTVTPCGSSFVVPNVAAFERDWSRMVRLAVAEDVYRAAATLAERHALKALDSLHLASFLSLRRRLPRSGAAFSSFDRRLNRAALRARWPAVSRGTRQAARPFE